MFSGIIQEVGSVIYFSRYQKKENLEVRSTIASDQAKSGDSVSVNGVCLTVTRKKASIVCFDVLSETSTLSTIGLLRVGERVNLEYALKASDTISGHFVTGHIDCMGTIKRKGIINKNCFYEIAVPSKFMHLVVPKGSVAIDGISLTVVDVLRDSFTVYAIPHTLQNTILHTKNHGKKVNIEFDILAKYAQHGMQK